MATPKKEFTPLTLQQRRFAEEYLIDGKTGAAAYRAGYKYETRHVQGSRLLADQRIKDYLAERKKKVMSNTGITPERIIQELMVIALSNVGDYITVDENGNKILDIAGIDRNKLGGSFEIQTDKEGKIFVQKVKVDPTAKIQALVQLGKHLGMFKEQVEHSGAISLEQLITSSMKEEDAS